MNYYNDNDPSVCDWVRNLIKEGLVPDGEVDSRSIADVQPGDLAGFTQCHFFCGILGWSLALQLAGVVRDVPLWTGSCPCQPFSSAGKQKGTADERHLWPEFMRLIRAGRPTLVFGEQVVGAIASGWLDDVCDDLEQAHYTTRADVLPASAFGFPHERERLYWFAKDAAHADGFGQSQPWQPRQDSGDYSKGADREAGGLVDAFRRQAMPFLCRQHDGIPAKVGQRAVTGLGNAIVPQLAAEFIRAYMEIPNA